MEHLIDTTKQYATACCHGCQAQHQHTFVVRLHARHPLLPPPSPFKCIYPSIVIDTFDSFFCNSHISPQRARWPMQCTSVCYSPRCSAVSTRNHAHRRALRPVSLRIIARAHTRTYISHPPVYITRPSLEAGRPNEVARSMIHACLSSRIHTPFSRSGLDRRTTARRIIPSSSVRPAMHLTTPRQRPHRQGNGRVCEINALSR